MRLGKNEREGLAKPFENENQSRLSEDAQESSSELAAGSRQFVYERRFGMCQEEI